MLNECEKRIVPSKNSWIKSEDITVPPVRDAINNYCYVSQKERISICDNRASSANLYRPGRGRGVRPEPSPRGKFRDTI